MRNLVAFCLAASLAWSLALPAAAERMFPPSAKRGELKAHQYPEYRIGARTYRMAAGGRIYNEQNMIIMPASLQGQTAQVVYTIDMNGQISALWLLTKAEASRYTLSRQDAEDKKKEEEEKKKREEAARKAAENR